MTNATYKCPKCNGSGYLSQYAGIANGVCFSCEGNGFKIGVAPVPGRLWEVYGTVRDTGAREVAYAVKAKTAADAIKKALKMFTERASDAYRAKFDLTNAEAV
jgi:hypothetical protein